MFSNLVADTYSPNVLFIVEKDVSAIHLYLYFLLAFHFNRSSFVCNLTSLGYVSYLRLIAC